MLKKKYQMFFQNQEDGMNAYVHADHAHDLVNRRSITDILLISNNIPIRLISKRQPVETSIHGSELVPSRMITELIFEVRFMLRSLGVDLDEPILMLGDNMTVVLNTSVT
jgi:hypothetical protein